MGGVRLGAASSPVGGKEGEGQETASSKAKKEGGGKEGSVERGRRQSCKL